MHLRKMFLTEKRRQVCVCVFVFRRFVIRICYYLFRTNAAVWFFVILLAPDSVGQKKARATQESRILN